MPRARDPNRDKAYEIWKEHKGKKKLKDIAEGLGVSDSQVRKWKSQDKWEQTKGNVTNSKRSVTKQEKPRYPNGHPGNKAPENKFTKRNQAARKHGLRAKYFTDTQREIMLDFQDAGIVEKLWWQIEIKFSAIIQLQKVMWVEDANDHLKEESGSSFGESGSSESYKIAFAYERYEAYIKAQSRAMAEYRNLVKSYLELANEDDERRLKLQVMQQQLKKLEKENASDSKTEDKLKDYFTALGGAFRDNG